MAKIPPYSLVWTRIPCISHVCPFIGHYGVTDSQGKMYDFDGPYHVNESRTHSIFGCPAKYLQFGGLTAKERENWDSNIIRAKRDYEQQNYNFFCNNCHNFAAAALNNGKVGGKRWTCCGLLCKTRCTLNDIEQYEKQYYEGSGGSQAE